MYPVMQYNVRIAERKAALARAGRRALEIEALNAARKQRARARAEPRLTKWNSLTSSIVRRARVVVNACRRVPAQLGPGRP
jgi:hypothetical protein